MCSKFDLQCVYHIRAEIVHYLKTSYISYSSHVLNCLTELHSTVMFQLVLSMDHSKCREKVCVVCSKKASRLVSKTEIDVIKTHVDGTYHVDCPEFPLGICTSCHIALNKKKNGQNVELLINQTYKNIRFLRSSDGKNC